MIEKFTFFVFSVFPAPDSPVQRIDWSSRSGGCIRDDTMISIVGICVGRPIFLDVYSPSQSIIRFGTLSTFIGFIKVCIIHIPNFSDALAFLSLIIIPGSLKIINFSCSTVQPHILYSIHIKLCLVTQVGWSH